MEQQKWNQWQLSGQWDPRGWPGQWSTLGRKVGTGSLGGRDPSGRNGESDLVTAWPPAVDKEGRMIPIFSSILSLSRLWSSNGKG